MRLYVFSNMYLSPIQHGIQGLHSMGEIMLKYPAHTESGQRFNTWLRDHKTVIVLCAGYSSKLVEIEEALEAISQDDPSMAFASFREEGLENALTSVAVVVSEASYNPTGDENQGDRFQIKDLITQFNGDGVEAARLGGHAPACFGKHYSTHVRLAALCSGFKLA